MPAPLENSHFDFRARTLAFIFFFLGTVIVLRLFVLMILNHDFYTKLAEGNHLSYDELFPLRGEVFLQDSRNGEEYPLAINRDYFTVFVDTRVEGKNVDNLIAAFSEILLISEEEKAKLLPQLLVTDDPYVPIRDKVEERLVDELKKRELPGVYFSRRPYRFYPEGNLAAQVVGFLGKTDDGKDIGRYGIEGYWQAELVGTPGFFSGEKSAAGRIIPIAGVTTKSAEDGSDILLTLDRTVQYMACERLRQGLVEYGATSASLIIMEPKTGAIRAMCSLPDFDPNQYGRVGDVGVYNNNTIFTHYEPGSIFKPITMAAALNEGLVHPSSYFYDRGSTDGVCSKPIRNANQKIYGDTTMTGVLEDSINTGMVYIAEKLGKNRFRDYIEKFGFGVQRGITLDKESGGNIDTLFLNKKDEVDCYTATASFGQGITATPLQMVTAFGAIASGGHLMKPYIVEEVRHKSGKTEKTKSQEVSQVVSEKTASLLSGMLVNVVENGHAKAARHPKYYIAGKTGTAQIAGPGGYSEDTNQSFVGFAPINDPKFVMIVKFEKPQRAFAESTAVPVFGDIAKFLFDYYGLPPER